MFQVFERKPKITAMPEEPFNNKVGRRAGRSDGSFWELSKFGTKSTCNQEYKDIKCTSIRDVKLIKKKQKSQCKVQQ